MITALKFAVLPLGHDEAFVALAASSAPHFLAPFPSNNLPVKGLERHRAVEVPGERCAMRGIGPAHTGCEV